MIIKTWLSQGWWLGLGGSLALVGAIAGGVTDGARAQITPDNTLGEAHSNVTQVGPPILGNNQITGGARRGANLFHSFQEFSIKAGQSAYFINPAGIENILSRVTGSSRSEILGTLGVLEGNANLFLINPNGIIFGPKARLELGGSFVATTANAIKFGNQGFFSASAANVPPVLTVNPSALLFNQIATQRIINQSVIPNVEDRSQVDGLRVNDGRSLLLVGGDVVLDRGQLRALGGRVELGGVAGAGTVGLDVNGNNLHLSYPAGVQQADVSLSNGAIVSASGAGGDIEVQGRRVRLTDGSQIVANTGGRLTVTASESVEVTGTSADGNPGGLFTQTDGAEAAGDLTIQTGRLIVQDGAVVSTSTFAGGQGGTLTVTASDSIELSGTSIDEKQPSGLFAVANGGSGAAGDLKIVTGKLIVRNGAVVSASTFNGAQGRGGTLAVKASDSVQLIGTSANGEIRSGLLVGTAGTGAAGDLTIATGRLIVQDGARVSAASLSGKAGGNITLQVQDLQLRRNSYISTKASDIGNGGNITIDTDTLAALENSDIIADAVKGRGGNIEITTQGLFRSPDSDITATSELGINGRVQINKLDIDPSRGLINLPSRVVDVSTLIAQGCSAVEPTASQFVVTGRGGLPPNPSEALSSDTVWTDLRPTIHEAENVSSSEEATQPTNSTAEQLVEAQGWVINANGEVVLTAQAPTVTPHIPWLTPTACHAP